MSCRSTISDAALPRSEQKTVTMGNTSTLRVVISIKDKGSFCHVSHLEHSWFCSNAVREDFFISALKKTCGMELISYTALLTIQCYEHLFGFFPMQESSSKSSVVLRFSISNNLHKDCICLVKDNLSTIWIESEELFCYNLYLITSAYA